MTGSRKLSDTTRGFIEAIMESDPHHPCPLGCDEEHRVFQYLGMDVYACPKMKPGTYAIVPSDPSPEAH